MMLFIQPNGPFHCLYPKRSVVKQTTTVVVTSFYPLSTCPGLTRERHRMVLSTRQPHGQRVGTGLQCSHSCHLLQLAPSIKSQAIQMSRPRGVQLLCRPKATTKTSSWLHDSRAGTSHALRSQLSPWTPQHRDCPCCRSGAGLQII